MVPHAYNPNTEEKETGESEAQELPWLLSDLEASWRYIRLSWGVGVEGRGRQEEAHLLF